MPGSASCPRSAPALVSAPSPQAASSDPERRFSGADRRSPHRPGATGALCLAVALAGLIALEQPAHAACSAPCQSPATWTQPFAFAGLTWETKSGCGGPGPNCWVSANAELVPGEGVRLRLNKVAGKWYAGEIRTTVPVAAGGYSVYVVGRPDLFDPNVVLGIFLYDDAAGEGGEGCPAELDVETSRFGDRNAPNGHCVVYEPGLCGPADLHDFTYSLTGTHTTHQIDWQPGSVRFRMMHGHRCAPEVAGHLIAERTYDSPAIPAAGQMRLHINLWAFAGNPPGDGQDVEIVIRDIVPDCQVLAAGLPLPTGEVSLAVRPNPSRAGADLHFVLPDPAHVRVSIHDVAGRQVASLVDGILPAGPHRLLWRPASYSAGVYFARIETGGRVITRRAVLIR